MGMGLLFTKVKRSKIPCRSRLPLYHDSSRRNLLSKERESETEYPASSDDDDLDERTDLSSPSPDSSLSRQTSSYSFPPRAIMLPKQSILGAPVRPVSRRHLYRTPNRIMRYLCLGMITTLLVFMYSLVRASQVENRKLAEGKIDRPRPAHVPDSGPPWENFEFLTRYYGGVRTLKPFSRIVPEYPRVEDEKPYNTTAAAAGSSELATPEASETSVDGASEPADKRTTQVSDPAKDVPMPSSKPFTEYRGSTVPRAEDHVQECFLDVEQAVRVPGLRYYDGRPDGFPLNVIGSYNLLSLPEDICFDRYGRYGPYGMGYSVHSGGLGIGEHGDKEGSEAVWDNVNKVDWKSMDWAEAQRRCYKANAARFKPTESRKAPPRGFFIAGTPKNDPMNSKLQSRETDMLSVSGKPILSSDADVSTASRPEKESSTSQAISTASRTAVVVRCWDEFLWNPDSIMNMRSLISELSLASGGRYDVHLLVQVKNDARDPVWADDEVYMRVIRERIPEEFQGMVTLWTETQMLSLYQGLFDLFARGPDLPVHGSYRGLQMAMQYFAYNHPEYDYFWQWEMDIRYTGHYLDLLTKLESWAKEQPRKGLWERNARFYFPAVHDSWEDFKHMARVQTEMGILGADNIWDNVAGLKQDPHKTVKKGEDTVWGPKRPAHPNDWFEIEGDPVPPTSYDKDKYTWGVGEEADLITLNPIFDPDGTTWGLSDDITGYDESEGTGKPPRRAQIITASRMSRTLLMAMHRETAFKKHHAFPEMWPATVALHHGLKAVFAPHPIFVDRAWPTEYMAQVFNGGRNGASGGARTSVYGDREHNLRGLTWFYDAGFSPNLYRRWLGLSVNNDGGEDFETTAAAGDDKDGSTVAKMRGGEGRMCLPPMLLHPIKDVILPVEEDQAVQPPLQSDPGA